MKHRIVHTLQKYLLNPPIKLALAIGLPLPGYALLETKGRKTGKPRRTPVGDGRIGNQFWLVAEHGMKAGYVRNIELDPRVRMKLREGLRTHWHGGTIFNRNCGLRRSFANSDLAKNRTRLSLGASLNCIRRRIHERV
jgi:hypothetical protein